jgi:hypothetical protein
VLTETTSDDPSASHEQHQRRFGDIGFRVVSCDLVVIFLQRHEQTVGENRSVHHTVTGSSEPDKESEVMRKYAAIAAMIIAGIFAGV